MKRLTDFANSCSAVAALPALTTGAFAGGAPRGKSTESVLISAHRLFDGVHFLEDQAILLEGDVVTAVGPPERLRERATKIMEALVFDANRMRFFLGAVVEAGEETELRKVLAKHAAALTGQIAEIFRRPADDPAVAAFVDRVRGLGIRFLLEPKRGAGKNIELAEIASECGLM